MGDRTGFLEFKPRDPVAQAKYSAMSPTWEGIESSNKAIASGVYDLDMAEKTRKNLRDKIPDVKLPKPISTSQKK
jgi:hypothetical protein